MEDSSLKRKINSFSALAFAWELGYTIAIPIVLFAFLGRVLDRIFSTSPLLLLGGIVASIFLIAFLVWRKASRFMV